MCAFVVGALSAAPTDSGRHGAPEGIVCRAVEQWSTTHHVCRAISHAHRPRHCLLVTACCLRLGAVPASVLSFVPKELGIRAALRMCDVRLRRRAALYVCMIAMSRLWLELRAASARCAGGGGAVWVALVVIQ
jgi:hypothetical protein